MRFKTKFSDSVNYFMVKSVSRRLKENPVFGLATRVGKIDPSSVARAGFPALFSLEKASFWPNESFIDQASLVKMGGYRLRAVSLFSWPVEQNA